MPLIMDVFHPVSYIVDHSLSGVQSHADLEIAHMWFTQSRDCAHVAYAISRLRTRVTQSRDCAHVVYAISRLRTCGLRNLKIAHTCYAIPRLPAQSQGSENAQCNLEIVQIPRLCGTYLLENEEDLRKFPFNNHVHSRRDFSVIQDLNIEDIEDNGSKPCCHQS